VDRSPTPDPAPLLADVLLALRHVREQLQRIEVRLALLPLPAAPVEPRAALPEPP
jgi:hypothetical protein